MTPDAQPLPTTETTSIHLFDDYSLRFPDDIKEFWNFFRQFRSVVFNNTPHLDLSLIHTPEELQATRELSHKFNGIYSLHLYIMKGEEPIGWFMGDQQDKETFYMRNTGILHEYRDKGIYSHFLPILLELVYKQGFQKVTSRHHTTNNQVIIPKLRAGFVISGMELSEIHGMLVNLTYFFNDKRRQVFAYRVGSHAPDASTRAFVSLDKPASQE